MKRVFTEMPARLSNDDKLMTKMDLLVRSFFPVLLYCNLFSLSCHSAFQHTSTAPIHPFDVYLFGGNSKSVPSSQSGPSYSRIGRRSSQVLSLL